MKTYNDFLNKVKYASKPIDFEKNKNTLQSIEITLYKEFISLLELNVEIIPAKVALFEIKKLSVETSRKPSEIIRLIGRNRKIHSIIDERKY